MYFLIYQLLHLSNDHHFKGSPYSTSAKIATFGVESLRRDTVAVVMCSVIGVRQFLVYLEASI